MCAHADSDTYSNINSKPNGDRDADGYSNSNRYSSRNSNGHAHCHADRNANSYGNSIPPNTNNGLDQGDGIFYRTDGNTNTSGHGPLNMDLIKDGTSNTFLIGEDIPSVNQWCSWPYSNNAVGTCAIPLNYQDNPLSTGDWPNQYSFRSNHSQGANFAYADGHVAFINQSIATTTYRALATYAGGETVSPP